MQIKSAISIIKTSYLHWQNHRASRMGAALSFYTIFSIVPLLMLMLFIAGPFLGHNYIQIAIVDQISNYVNKESAEFIKSIIVELNEAKFNLIAIVISIGTIAIGTLGVFNELKNSLDDLWDTNQSSNDTKGLKYYFSSHLLSLSVIPMLGFLLIISIVFSALLGLISESLPVFSEITYLFKIISFIFSFFVLNFLFTFIYRFLPKRKLPWRELVRGALITTTLFILGKFVIGIYILHIAGTSLFGAAGAFVLLLLWIYYSVQIFLFGASLTYIYSRRYGHLKQG